MKKPLGIAAAVAAVALAVTPLAAGSAVAGDQHGSRHHQRSSHHGEHGKPATLPGGYKHLVVIYEENHSFDNLYGGWGPVNGQQVDGLRRRGRHARTQVAQDGTRRTPASSRTTSTSPSPPLAATCTTPCHGHRAHSGSTATSRNAPSAIDDYIGPADKTCPAPGAFDAQRGAQGHRPAGGCTRDLVHRFYQEQYQIDGGKQDRYIDRLRRGRPDHGQLRHQAAADLPATCTARAPRSTSIADDFFQAAFGGSFLNHQWLIAARTPLDSDAAGWRRNSVVDANGMPNTYPLYTPTGDRSTTAS